MGLILLILLILLIIGGLPEVPLYDHGYGYYPSGILSIVFVILLILLLLGRI